MTKRLFALALLFIGMCAVLWQTKSAALQGIDFVRDIQPIFKANCERCHGAKISQAGLRFDQKKYQIHFLPQMREMIGCLVHYFSPRENLLLRYKVSLR